MRDITSTKDLNNIYSSLEYYKEQQVSEWEDIACFLAPHMGKFDDSDGSLKKSIDYIRNLNSDPPTYLNTLAAGLMSGISNQSTHWFNFTIRGFEPANDEQKYQMEIWLNNLQDTQEKIFNRSNVYQTLLRYYQELCAFGTGCFLLEEDLHKGINCVFLTIGSYNISINASGEVDTLGRHIILDTKQMAENFGEDCLSEVEQAIRTKSWNKKWTVKHLIYPNTNYLTNGPKSNYAYKSIYWYDNTILRESAYQERPFVCTRFYTNDSETIWGTGLGHLVLGDLRQVNKQERDVLISSDRIINSPVNAPSSLKNINLKPNGVNFYDSNLGGKGISTIYNSSNINLAAVAEMADRTLKRISKNLYVDTFLMLSQRDKDMTAYEVSELMSERMQILGPLYNIIKTDGLDVLFDRALSIEFRTHQLPPPPDFLGGKELKVEYESVLAQAQKAQSLNKINQAMQWVTSVATTEKNLMQTSVGDNIDLDKLLEKGLDAIGSPASIRRDPQTMAQIRQARSQAQQQQAQQQQAQVQANNLLKVSQAGQHMADTNVDPEKKSLLNNVL